MNIKTEQIFLLNVSESQLSSSSQRTLVELAGAPGNDVENVEDFSQVCRTCASVTEFQIPMFEGEGLQNKLADKINKHLPIQVSPADALPTALCVACANTLLAWHELARCARRADAALRRRREQLGVAHEQHAIKNEKCEDPENTEQKELQTTVIKNVLKNYFHTLNADENSLTCVCQKCPEKPTYITIEEFTEHLLCAHSELNNKDAVERFIKNYVTFEETLTLEDSDREENTNKASDVVFKDFYCPYCSNVFSSATRLACHLSKHIGVCIDEGVICCGKQYDEKIAFVKHLQESHVDRSDTANTCRNCGFVAESSQDLHTHVTTMHKNATVVKRKKIKDTTRNQKYIPVPCPECQKMFSNKYHMLTHARIHQLETQSRFSCLKCNKTYRCHKDLRLHTKVVHEGVLKFHCSFCGEAFPTRIVMNNHVRLHTGQKPFTCQYCYKSFRSKQTLTSHIEMHLDIRKYKCDICDKGFRKSSHLKYHLRSHKKEDGSNEGCLLRGMCK